MATQQPEEQTGINRIVSKTPWWAVSGGLHTLSVLALSFIVVLHEPAADETAVIVAPPRKRPPQTEMEIPKDLHLTGRTSDVAPLPTTVEDEDREPLESDDTDEHHQRKDDSVDYVSDKPFRGKMSFDVVAPSAGGGGRYGTRLGGKAEALRRGGGSGQTEAAVLAALRWLARHQRPDGSWGASDYVKECGRFSKHPGKCAPNPSCGADLAVTGLAVLAFLGAGYTHRSNDTYDGFRFGEVVGKALTWLVAQQRNGKFLDHTYSQSIATMALCEAVGMGGASLFSEPAQNAIQHLVDMQNPYYGWRYRYRCGDNDTSNSGWAILACKSAEISALFLDPRAYAGMRKWLAKVTHCDTYETWYNEESRGCKHPSNTAIGTISRVFMDKDPADPMALGGARVLLSNLPNANDIDYYYWYYGSLALFQISPAQGWKEWNDALTEALLPLQNKESRGCKWGSWEPIGCWAKEGGRVYSTALNALTLEVYYRYAHVFTGNHAASPAPEVSGGP